MHKRRDRLFMAGLLAVGLTAAGPSAARPRREGPEASDKDRQAAIEAIRRVALDADETEEHRANAIAAYAKLLVGSRRHDEALKLCIKVLAGTDKAALAGAALRAGCLVQRDRRGHLGAEAEFLASQAKGRHARTASALASELKRATRALASLAGRAMVPRPVAVHVPGWAAAGPGKAPSALRVELPRIGEPSWYGRVAFPLLKESKKK